MSTVQIPTPLRPYTDGRRSVEVKAESVGEALIELVHEFPALRQHLYDGDGRLRSYVNLFVNEEDIRGLDGHETTLNPADHLKIIPSIAGGAEAEPQPSLVDHSALRVNQASIIALTLLAFVLDAAWLVLLTGVVMLFGSLIGRPAFVLVYRLIRAAGAIKPEVMVDHPEPHRFSQTLGGAFLFGGFAALIAGLATLGWILAWIVIALAALNLFGGFCVGCALYYWLNRAGIPGFDKEPLPGTVPGRRPGHGRG